MTPQDILKEREKTHGDFKEASETHYKTKALLRPVMEKNMVPLYRIEAIEAIIAKINRIVHGDHNHADHWDDIAGYAMLGKGKKQDEEKEWFKTESCNHNNKKRMLYTDAANEGDVTLIADACLVCNKLYLVDFMHQKFMNDSADATYLQFASAISLENKMLKEENERLEAENKRLKEKLGNEAISKMETSEWISVKNQLPELGRKVEVKIYKFTVANVVRSICPIGLKSFWKYSDPRDNSEMDYVDVSLVTHWRYQAQDECPNCSACGTPCLKCYMQPGNC